MELNFQFRLKAPKYSYLYCSRAMDTKNCVFLLEKHREKIGFVDNLEF